MAHSTMCSTCWRQSGAAQHMQVPASATRRINVLRFENGSCNTTLSVLHIRTRHTTGKLSNSIHAVVDVQRYARHLVNRVYLSPLQFCEAPANHLIHRSIAHHHVAHFGPPVGPLSCYPLPSNSICPPVQRLKYHPSHFGPPSAHHLPATV